MSRNPVTPSAQSPSTGARPSSSRPSSVKNSMAASRSSTTMPTLSIRFTVKMAPWRLTSAGPPKHRRHTRCCTHLKLLHDFEAEPLVERDVARVRRLQIGQRAVLIAAGDGVTHQLRSKSLALSLWVDANHRQIPMRLFGMRLIHFLKGGQEVVQVLGLRRVAEYLLQRLTIRLHSWR